MIQNKSSFYEGGNGDLTTEERSVGPFTQVQNNTPVNVIITEGAQSLSVTVDSNLQPLLTTTVVLGTLIIGTKEPIKASPDSKVQVSVPELAGVTLNGAGGVSATVTTPRDISLLLNGAGPLTFQGPARNLSLSLNGAGALTFQGPASAVEATNQGFGPMQLSGSAESLKATVSGFGALDAKGLPVSGSADIINNGTGQLSTTVNGTVSFLLTGFGNINWYGTATVTSWHDFGLGRIIPTPS
jgi:hypothetical protein